LSASHCGDRSELQSGGRVVAGCLHGELCASRGFSPATVPIEFDYFDFRLISFLHLTPQWAMV